MLFLIIILHRALSKANYTLAGMKESFKNWHVRSILMNVSLKGRARGEVTLEINFERFNLLINWLDNLFIY